MRGDVLHLKEVNVFALGIRFSPGLKVSAILTPPHPPPSKGGGAIEKISKMFAGPSLIQEFRLDLGCAFNQLLGGFDIANDGRQVPF